MLHLQGVAEQDGIGAGRGGIGCSSSWTTASRPALLLLAILVAMPAHGQLVQHNGAGAHGDLAIKEEQEQVERKQG